MSSDLVETVTLKEMKRNDADDDTADDDHHHHHHHHHDYQHYHDDDIPSLGALLPAPLLQSPLAAPNSQN